MSFVIYVIDIPYAMGKIIFIFENNNDVRMHILAHKSNRN